MLDLIRNSDDHTTITRHQEDKLSKATNSHVTIDCFPILYLQCPCGQLEPDTCLSSSVYRPRLVFLVSGDCCVALPRGAMGLSAVCDCDIS